MSRNEQEKSFKVISNDWAIQVTEKPNCEAVPTQEIFPVINPVINIMSTSAVNCIQYCTVGLCKLSGFYVDFIFRDKDFYQSFVADFKPTHGRFFFAKIVINNLTREGLENKKAFILNQITTVDHDQSLKKEIDAFFERIVRFLKVHSDFFLPEPIIERRRKMRRGPLSAFHPGLKKFFQAQLDVRENEKRLSEIHIDSKKIPQRFVCPITDRIMDNPMIDPTMVRPGNRDEIPRFEAAAFFAYLFGSNGLSQTTNALIIDPPRADDSLKNEIDEYVSREEIEAEEYKELMTVINSVGNSLKKNRVAQFRNIFINANLVFSFIFFVITLYEILSKRDEGSSLKMISEQLFRYFPILFNLLFCVATICAPPLVVEKLSHPRYSWLWNINRKQDNDDSVIYNSLHRMTH